MATRSGKRREELPSPANRESDSQFDTLVQQLSGWSVEELSDLVTKRIVPDHWNGTPCFALMEAIRHAIYTSCDQSCTTLFPLVFETLKWKPNSSLCTFLSRLRRMVQKAQSHNIHLLLSEFPGSPQNLQVNTEVGPLCQRSGITKDYLTSSKPSNSSAINVTNAMVIELLKHRERSGTTWETVASEWWPNLFQCKTPLGTIQSSWCQVLKRHGKLRKEERTEFENRTYTIPQPKPATCTAQADEIQFDGKEDDQGDVLDDSSDEDLDCFPDRVSDHTIDSIVHCIQLLTNCYEDERGDHESTQRELARCKKREKMLNDAYDDMLAVNADLKQTLSNLKRKNIVRRLQRREEELEEKNETIQKLHKKIEQLESRLQTIQKSKKNVSDSRRHFRTNTKNFSDVKKDLKRKINSLELENDNLQTELDDIMADKEVRAFENGRYTNDIRLVCYELIARGVGSRHVSDIIRIVLKDIGKMNIERLPKPTLIRYLAVEQALLNKECARSRIQESDTPVTLHTDGTTKKRKGYVTFLASTEDQTVGMSLHDIEVETGESLLTDTKETLEELVRLNLSDDKEEVHRLLAKFKTTMTDRSIVNKAYIQKLEQWRSNILPQVTENWENLDDGVKQEIATINDMYCGKHLVLNLQEYSASALCEWEKVEANEGKLGREKQVLWNRGKTESATLLAVRSFCNLLGPDCDEQSGLTEEFKSIVQKSFLVSYRGNRFNVPFHNSAAVYHHISDFHRLCASLDSKREANMYVKSLKADFDDDIVVAGIRAMGIVNQHITAPLMRMLESKVHIMDTDQYYTRLHDKIQEWMVDPSPLLTDSSVLFPAFPPIKDSIHKSLYDPCSANIEQLTKQALMIILHNCLVCVTRQLSDHLPGGRFHSAPEDVRKQTASCPKDNLCAERMFAGLDYLKRKMPNANTVALEGILLWSLNKTRDYLEEMSDKKKDQYLSEAVKQRKSFLQLYQRRRKAIKESIAEKLLMNKRRKEDKLKEVAKQRAQTTAEALELCGMLCTSNDDVSELKQKAKGTRQLEKFLISQIKYWKSTCTGGVKMELFYLTKKGKKLSVEELEKNLRAIMSQIMECEHGSPVQSLPQSPENIEERRHALKQKILSKISPSKKKRRGPFPGDRIIHKRIRHIFVDAADGSVLECKGTVLRRATNEDLESLVESCDKKLKDTYVFYTILYDPPYADTNCYPLQKEWEEGTLELM